MIRRALFTAAAVAVGVAVWALPAGAHYVITDVQLDCATASVPYAGFNAGDFPIVFHVTVLGVAHAITADADTVPQGTASVDISALTAQLHGVEGTVSAYVTWASSDTHFGLSGPIPLTCGEPVPPVTEPSTTAPPVQLGSPVPTPAARSATPARAVVARPVTTG